MKVTADQIRAARALLNLKQDELAKRARVSIATIRRVESAGYMTLVASGTMDEIRHALEDAGIEFIEDGIRTRQRLGAERAALFNALKAISARSAGKLRRRDLMSEADLYDDGGLPV